MVSWSLAGTSVQSLQETKGTRHFNKCSYNKIYTAFSFIVKNINNLTTAETMQGHVGKLLLSFLDTCHNNDNEDRDREHKG